MKRTSYNHKVIIPSTRVEVNIIKAYSSKKNTSTDTPASSKLLFDIIYEPHHRLAMIIIFTRVHHKSILRIEN